VTDIQVLIPSINTRLGAIRYGPYRVCILFVHQSQYQYFAGQSLDALQAFVQKRCPFKWTAVSYATCERGCVCTDIWHVMCQILYYSEKLLDVIVHPWGEPFSYPLHFVMNSLAIDDGAEAFHPLRVEVYLFLAENKVVLA
jgi:hypothetical protein